MIDKIKKIDYRHFILIGTTIIFLAFTFFCFPSAWTRFIESCVDFGNSIACYLQEVFGARLGASATVVNSSAVPMTPLFGLPATWEEFKILWGQFWELLFNGENFTQYWSTVGNVLYHFCKFLAIGAVPLVLIVWLCFRRVLNTQNNDYNHDSKPLQFHKKFVAKVYLPFKSFVADLIGFLKENKKYIWIWVAIWAWNFNLIVIVIEFLAYYFFFVSSFQTSTIYFQFYKLLSDLSVPLAFIPTFAWVLIGYFILCYIRKKIGYARLNHLEHKNCGFINERPIVLMVCGTMGKKKTTIITDIALSQEAMLRDKAYEKLLENDLKFPYFPWINFENALKRAIAKHKVYNLATARKFVNEMYKWFELGYAHYCYEKWIVKHLRKKYGYTCKNLCFDYDHFNYGLFYNDNLKEEFLWETLETYAQLYLIYVVQSSLIVSNYSIRTDNVFVDLGNFPLWDTDFFQRDCRLMFETSRHSHIVDFDALRLGKKLLLDNEKKDSFEFGVVNLTEIGKERKNTIELQGIKKTDDITNQKNDGFNDWLKMVRHSATVDYFPFVKVITDEQRPESWGADARDLLDIVHIREADKTKLLMPFFGITELLYKFIFSKFENWYMKYRHNRADNILLMHLFKSLASKFNHYCTRMHNTFGCCECDIQVEGGAQDGVLKDKKYYLLSKKIYSRRFSTDCFSDFFNQKSLKSQIGLDDLEEYADEKATFEELQKQNSYFMNDLTNKKNDEN